MPFWVGRSSPIPKTVPTGSNAPNTARYPGPRRTSRPPITPSLSAGLGSRLTLLVRLDSSYRQSCTDSGEGGRDSSQQGHWRQRWRLGDGVPAAKPANHSQANFFTHGLLWLLPSSEPGFLSVPIRKPADTLLSSASVHLCGLWPSPWLRGGGTQVVNILKKPTFLLFFSNFLCGSTGKESTCNVEDLGSIPGLGRPLGEGKRYPLQYSGLENSTDYTGHGVTRVRHNWVTFAFPGGLDSKESACREGDTGSIPGSGRSPGEGNTTHSSILAWRMPRTEKPGGLQSTGSQRVRCDWVTNTFIFNY